MGRGDGSYHMPRTCHIVLLVLQLISTFERQIFDFMGYMWLPILANFLNIIFVIFGLFAVVQYSARYMLAYSVWTLIWLAYNVFIICYYLDVGDLDKKDDILRNKDDTISNSEHFRFCRICSLERYLS
jgi:sodium/potassium-transporting ATPase subunit beta-1-interacting protein